MKLIGTPPANSAEAELYNYFGHSLGHVEGTAWFNLDIASTNEIDCLVWFQDYGCFAIEVKGYLISQLDCLSDYQITFRLATMQEKYGQRPTPWRQAKDAAKKISTYIRSNSRKLGTKLHCPYILPLVYFPYISKAQFSAAYPHATRLMEQIVFNDANTDTSYFCTLLETLAKQNRESYANQKEIPAGSIQKYIADTLKDSKERYQHVGKLEYLFVSNLLPNAYERYDNQLIESVEKADFQKEIQQINLKYPVYRYGYAGSGKTLLGLKILQMLTVQGQRVLFTCFNKVLATDVGKLHKARHKEDYKHFENLTVSDIHEVMNDLCDVDYTGHEDAYSMQVDSIIQKGFYKESFDFILVDEAQDLRDYAWRLIIHLSRNGHNSLMVLNGKEQNLYLDKPSIHLKNFIQNANRLQEEYGLSANCKRKNRIYRNKSNAFLFAQCFLEKYPDVKAAANLILENRRNENPTFKFVRDEGPLPKIVKLEHFDFENECIAIRNVLIECITETKDQNFPECGILILVPFQSRGNPNPWRDLAVRILTDLECKYIDYTIDDERRTEYQTNQVRIAPYHSSRGIESTFTIILGFEELFTLCAQVNCDYHKLGYIVLSRSKFDTWIFVNQSEPNNNAIAFVRYCEELYKIVAKDEKLIYSDSSKPEYRTLPKLLGPVKARPNVNQRKRSA